MPIDPSIAMGVRPVQIDNPLNAMARALQIKGMVQQQEMGEFDAQLKRRTLEQQNRLQAILAGGGGVSELMKGGHLKEARELAETNSKVEKEKREAEKFQLENARSKLGLTAQILGSATDQQTWDRARETARAAGLDVSRAPEMFDPGLVAQKVQEALSATEKLDQIWKKKGYDLDVQKANETGRHNREKEKTAAGQLGVAQGNLGLRKQELDLQKNQPKGQFLETPTGYVLADPRSNAVQPVIGPDGKQLRGKAADKSLTDAQAKANLFGSRMAESHRILTDLTGKFSPAAVQTKMAAGETPFLGGAFGAVGNMMLSTEGQMAEQAMRDFINAVLRRESGAVISPPEFANAAKQYFPQPNDTPEVLAQKKRNREIAIAGLAAEVPGGLRSVPSLKSPGGEDRKAIQPGSVEDGYRFKGGNPADPNSWEKV